MASQYIRCDFLGCQNVVDRRPHGDFANRASGTFDSGQQRELFAYARSLGWSIEGDSHLCPDHARVTLKVTPNLAGKQLAVLSDGVDIPFTRIDPETIEVDGRYAASVAVVPVERKSRS